MFRIEPVQLPSYYNIKYCRFNSSLKLKSETQRLNQQNYEFK